MLIVPLILELLGWCPIEGENLNSILGEKVRKRKKISIVICFPWRGIIPFVFQSVEEGERERIWRGAVVCRKNISVEFVQGWAMPTPLIHYAATWSWNCEDSFVPLTRGILTNRAWLSEWRFERHSLAIVSFFLCSCFPTVIYICIYLHQSVENDSIFTTRRF